MHSTIRSLIAVEPFDRDIVEVRCGERGRIALEHREHRHALLEQRRVGRRHLGPGVRPKDDQPFRLESSDGLADRQCADAELLRERVDDEPESRAVGAAQDSLAEGAYARSTLLIRSSSHPVATQTLFSSVHRRDSSTRCDAEADAFPHLVRPAVGSAGEREQGEAAGEIAFLHRPVEAPHDVGTAHDVLLTRC